jgi:hypothetical protein
MEIVIKNGMKKREIERKMKELENSSKKKLFNPYKYLGKIDWKETPLNIQKKMRDDF